MTTRRKNAAEKPNIVILYADDLGFGDLGCYGAADVPTPNLDRLAAGGLRFTNGYSTAATCTPARYSLLTGSYPWRNAAAAILPGDAPLIIPPGSPTLPTLLRAAGYRTGAIGKWHLGLGAGHMDWNQAIRPGPGEIGFDDSFIMPATNDRVPCVFVENGRVTGLDPADPIEVRYGGETGFPGKPTGKGNPELLRMRASHGHDQSIVNGVGRIGHMRGGTAALWRDEDMADTFVRKAVAFLEANRGQPFFLYHAFHEPHVPRLPSPRFAGVTRLGPRGDVIVELDWCVGEILAALERLGLTEDTLVVFSSDNGPVLDDGYEDRAMELCGSHRPAGPLRGGKYSLFDGGTRVPFLVRWPGRVKPGLSEALVCQVDFCASLAALVGQPLPRDGAPDSVDVLAALLGESPRGRTELVTEGTRGKVLLRQDNWVFIPPYQGVPVFPYTGIESGCAEAPQLYDLGADLGERRNLAEARPEVAARMAARLSEVAASRRTRPPIAD